MLTSFPVSIVAIVLSAIFLCCIMCWIWMAKNGTASPNIRKLLVLVRIYQMSRNSSENSQFMWGCGPMAWMRRQKKSEMKNKQSRWEWRENECNFQRKSTKRMLNIFLYTGNDFSRAPAATRSHSAYVLWAEYGMGAENTSVRSAGALHRTRANK